MTPSYNQGRFIADCIASVARQTYPNVEHVICDGGSTDDTLEILQDAPDTVVWQSGPDGGQSNAVNKALGRSSGEILGWLNSDDAYFDPRAIEAAVAVFTDEPEVDVVYGHAALVAANGELIQLLWVPPYQEWLHRRTNFVIQPAAFIRRSAVDDVLLDESYDFTMDRELWVRLRGRGSRFARLPLIAAIDRHHSTRKSYTLEDVGDRDRDRLGREYGLPDWRKQTWLSAGHRIAARFLGVGLFRAAYGDTAFPVQRPPRATLLRRQVAMRRRAMPIGEPDVTQAADHG